MNRQRRVTTSDVEDITSGASTALKQIIQDHQDFLANVQERHDHHAGLPRRKMMNENSIGFATTTVATQAVASRADNVNSKITREWKGSPQEDSESANLLKKVLYQPTTGRRGSVDFGSSQKGAF
mmetsp:Transcript_9111/g.20587  ORF Transcript_9111/g.20587 Transcript_9111/m.20587 type:complete len:125 (-) Transcript_9111:258-632(-)